MPMPVTKELSAIPFGSLIGGPLTAAIEAQAKAAYSTVEFINAIGFNDDGDVQNITFKFKGPEQNGIQTLEVPLLTIVPIPFIRIDDMTIDFKASMSQSTGTETKQSDIVEKQAKISGSASYLFFRASLDASVSSKKDSTSTKNSKYAVEYTIDVNVHAVQDDMPGGLARVLNILTESINQNSGRGESEKPAERKK
jgi:hypothetical protein